MSPAWFDARVKKRTEDVEVVPPLCVSLPSEILGQLWRFSRHSLLLDPECFDRLSHEHHNAMAASLQCQNLLGIGLHGDGVPCNWDRPESVSILSINLPGVPGYSGRLRIPVAIVPDWCIGEHCLDDIMEILAWDLRSLLSGSCASSRHDGSAWRETDAKRSKRSGVLRTSRLTWRRCEEIGIGWPSVLTLALTTRQWAFAGDAMCTETRC